MAPISSVLLLLLLLLLLMAMPITRRRAAAVAVAGPATPSTAEQLEGIGNAGWGGRTPFLVVHPHHDGCHGLLVGVHLNSPLLVLLCWSGTLEAAAAPATATAAVLRSRTCLLPRPSSPISDRRACRCRICRPSRRRHGNRGVSPLQT